MVDTFDAGSAELVLACSGNATRLGIGPGNNLVHTNGFEKVGASPHPFLHNGTGREISAEQVKGIELSV